MKIFLNSVSNLGIGRIVIRRISGIDFSDFYVDSMLNMSTA